MSEEEIIKYAKIFSNAKGDTHKINFVNENKTIDEVEIWKEILKLIDKKDKVIDLMALHIASSAIVDDMVCMYKDCENENCTADMSIQCTKEYFFEKAEEER